MKKNIYKMPKKGSEIVYVKDYQKPAYGSAYLLSLYRKLMTYMAEDDVDLQVNSETGLVFTEDVWGNKHDRGIYPNPSDFESIGLILAGLEEKTLNIEYPILDSRIPYDNSRVHITIPENTAIPTISLRKHHEFFSDINKLQQTGMFTERQKRTMLKAVKERRNIIISGETGSGKTTLLSALANKIDPNETLVIIEDTKEIDVSNFKHVIRSATGTYVTGADAVQGSLRQNPTRILYGEVRNESAYDLIDSWNTAHKGGMGTIHANSCDAVKQRLLMLCPKERDPKIFEMAVNEALDIVIQISKKSLGKGKIQRFVSEIKDFKA